MAITDLLWACPECRAQGLRGTGGGAVCDACGATYERGPGATIRRKREGETPLTRSAAEWLDRLPPIERLLDAGRDPVLQGAVRLKAAEGEEPVYGGGRFLNRIARFGATVAGTLRLHADRLAFEPDPGEGEGEGRAETWGLDELTALQPSSKTLQIKARARPLVSLSFPGGSVRLWEELLSAALRRRYRELGHGEIVEFQPRIVTR